MDELAAILNEHKNYNNRHTSLGNPEDSTQSVSNENRRPKLIVVLGYGDELPIYKIARALWDVYHAHFHFCDFLFVKDAPDLPSGEVAFDENDLLIGCKTTHTSDVPGYAATGHWSPDENIRLIHRQMSIYKYLLSKFKYPFYVYQSTITSVVNLPSLASTLFNLPNNNCFAGSIGRINTPGPLNGLTFVSGANSLFSSDLIETMVNRFIPDSMENQFPNDIWQAWTLRDVPRIPMPMFSFSQQSPLPDLEHKVTHLINSGHIHFRIRSNESDNSFKREEVEPKTMSKVMKHIIDNPSSTIDNVINLRKSYHHFVNSNSDETPAFSSEPLFRGPRDFPLIDKEI